MKVAVVNFTSGNLSGGYQKYVERLMPLLRERPEISELRVYAPHGYSRGTKDNPVERWPAGSTHSAVRWIRRAVSEFSPDVVFIPTARLVNIGDAPTVTMVRNMEPLVAEAEEGNPIGDRIRNAARRWAARRACEGATRVIAVSDFVKEVIQEKWSIPDSRIGVVPHGVEQIPPRAQMSAQSVQSWLGGRPFLFTAGSIRPARGLEDLVKAWPSLRHQQPEMRLVVAGSADRAGASHLEHLKKEISSLGADDEVMWAGQLSSAEMGWCFANAAAFVMTSRVEACPNVVLEAMANGAVSVSTDARPMPEFFADTAEYYQARSPDSLSAAVARLLRESDQALAQLRADAKRRAAEFTWDRTAERTVEELERAISAKR